VGQRLSGIEESVRTSAAIGMLDEVLTAGMFADPVRADNGPNPRLESAGPARQAALSPPPAASCERGQLPGEAGEGGAAPGRSPLVGRSGPRLAPELQQRRRLPLPGLQDRPAHPQDTLPLPRYAHHLCRDPAALLRGALGTTRTPFPFLEPSCEDATNCPARYSLPLEVTTYPPNFISPVKSSS
jgi:hypothetical protein